MHRPDDTITAALWDHSRSSLVIAGIRLGVWKNKGAIQSTKHTHESPVTAALYNSHFHQVCAETTPNFSPKQQPRDSRAGFWGRNNGEWERQTHAHGNDNVRCVYLPVCLRLFLPHITPFKCTQVAALIASLDYALRESQWIESHKPCVGCTEGTFFSHITQKHPPPTCSEA